MKYPLALQAFEQMIDRMHADLERYAAKPDANQKRIDIINSQVKICDIFKESVNNEFLVRDHIEKETLAGLMVRIKYYENMIDSFVHCFNISEVNPDYFIKQKWVLFDHCMRANHLYLKNAFEHHSFFKRIEQEYATQSC